MQFTLKLGAYSAAKDLQSPTSADFDIDIDEWKGKPTLLANELIKTNEHPLLKFGI